MVKPIILIGAANESGEDSKILAVDTPDQSVSDTIEASQHSSVADIVDVVGGGGSWMELGSIGVATDVAMVQLTTLGTGRWTDFHEAVRHESWDELTDPAVFDISDIPPPAPPTNVIAMGGNHKITVTWNPDPDSISFNIRRSDNITGPFVQIGTSTGPVYIDEGLINGKAYYYVITGVNNGGEGMPSEPARGIPTPETDFEVISMFDFETDVLTYMARWGSLQSRAIYALKLAPGVPRDLSSGIARITHPKGLLIQSYDNEFFHDIGGGFTTASSKFVFMDLNEAVAIPTLRVQSDVQTTLIIIVAGDP